MIKPIIELSEFDQGIIVYLSQPQMEVRRQRDMGAVRLFMNVDNPDVRIDKLYMLQTVVEEALVRFQ